MDIELFPEEDSMNISDDWQTTTITLDKKNKEFESRMSLNEDCYFRTQKYKYKIYPEPIEVKTKLEERHDEPPLQYMVRDGVVLESEITKDGALMTKSLIEDLKKEVEWQLAWIGSPIGLFIVSQHPEIISKEEFRKYLRQAEEKIKNAVIKVERYLKEKDKSDLQVKEGKFGRYIGFAEEKELNDKEQEKWGKYIDGIHKKIFEEDSSEYVGITYSEFSNSSQMLKTFEVFLNPKVSKTEAGESTIASGRNGGKWALIIILAIIALSWGIWTAIGVFFFGSIIMGLLSKQN